MSLQGRSSSGIHDGAQNSAMTPSLFKGPPGETRGYPPEEGRTGPNHHARITDNPLPLHP